MAGVIHLHLLQSGAIFPAGFHLSRQAANTAIWTTGLVLQCALVCAVFWRRAARVFPAFTALIVFYPLRAGVLYALAGRLDSGDYDSLFNALAFVEVLLQTAVAIELTIKLVRGIGGWTRRRAIVLLVLLGIAFALTWIALSTFAERQLADRVQVFAWFVMTALFAAVWKRSRSRNLTRIAAGFAAFSLMQLAALAGCTHAMLKHDAGRYVAWSYVPACAYLAVVIFWLAALAREPRQAPDPSPA